MIHIDSVICGDSIELLNDIPDASLDLVLTDPPYGIKYISNRRKDGPTRAIKNDDAFFCPIDILWSKLKPTGCALIFYSHKIPFIDERIKNVCIWVKNNHTAGDLEGDFANQYECCAFLPKEKFKLPNGRTSNVWSFDKVNPTDMVHPTEKPIELLKHAIYYTTKPGDIVLDCFAGSGSTLIAAKRLGRHYIGMELEQNYVDIINYRLSRCFVEAPTKQAVLF